MKPKTKAIIREYVESILIAFVLAMFVRTFVVAAFKIPSGSMIPTLQPGDKIFVNKFIYGTRIPFTNFRLLKLSEVERGDVMVFRFPGEPKRDFIKRVIAKSGETVEIAGGRILIDGKEIKEPPVLREIYYYNRGDYGEEGLTLTVPEGSLYVLGDNSASSRDSRYWGFVPMKNVVGKAFLIWWPIRRIRLLNNQ